MGMEPSMEATWTWCRATGFSSTPRTRWNAIPPSSGPLDSKPLIVDAIRALPLGVGR